MHQHRSLSEKTLKKLKILFLCTGNSCRSQMAEGWAHHLLKEIVTPYSAGLESHGLNPFAVQVMAEAGVDITGQTSKTIARFLTPGAPTIDIVVTVCDHAAETCPLFPGTARIIHQSFPDPPRMAADLAARGASEEAQLNCYRQVRDQIRTYIETLPQNLSLK